jgi:hypothetical protein
LSYLKPSGLKHGMAGQIDYRDIPSGVSPSGQYLTRPDLQSDTRCGPGC